MKNLLMIGASERHKELMKAFKEQSSKVFIIAIDKDKNATGKQYADVFVPVSITDMDSALLVAKDFDIDGCVAIPDIGAETGAYINSSLGLKGIKHPTYLKMTDKRLSKHCFKRAGITIPASYPEGSFPYISKPVDSTGSNGVVKIENNDHFAHFLTSGKPFALGSIILEEFIEGDMFSVDLMMQDSNIKYSLVQDRFLGYDNCFVDGLIVSPSRYDSYLDKILPICEKALASLDFTDGPANLQFIARDGEFYLIEVNPRISGPYGIECHTMSTHVDWFYDIVMSALGDKVLNAHIQALNQPNALITIGAKGNGIISHVTYPEITGTVDGYWRWKEDGDYVNKISSVKDSIEHIFIMENNLMSVMDRAYTILNETRVYFGRNE